MAQKIHKQSVFISYAAIDRWNALKVARFLRKMHYKVTMTPHQKYSEGHSNASFDLLKDADRVICVCSPQALRSKRVWRDMALARVMGRAVIPVLMTPFLGGKTPIRNYIDATTNTNKGMRQLLKVLAHPRKYKSNQIAKQKRPHRLAWLGLTTMVVLSMFSMIAFLG